MMKTIFIILSLACCLIAQAQVGINTIAPQGTLHVVATDNDDPLILADIQDVNAPTNQIDASKATYLDLKISKDGVVRRETPRPFSVIYLAENTKPVGLDQPEGTMLNWLIDDVSTPYITLPEDGTFVFSIRFYGSISITDYGTSYYPYLYKLEQGATSNPVLMDSAEIFVGSCKNESNILRASYTVDLAATGNARDRIYVMINHHYLYAKIEWVLRGGVAQTHDMTSLMYWKL